MMKNEPTTMENKKPDRRLRGLVSVMIGIIIGIVLCAGSLAITSARNATAAAREATQEPEDYTEKIDLILNYLALYYLEDLDESQVTDMLAKGLLENIGDKYAQYYTEKEFTQLMEETNGEYAGIGVQIAENENNEIQVYRVFAGSPAEEAGVQIRDVIVEAGGQREFENLDELVSIVRGEPGTTVDVVVLRGEEEIPMTIERRNIIMDSVYGRMLTDTLGYIEISEFNRTTIQQFADAVADLTSQGMQNCIMDLRGNPGGDYDSVVAVCDQVVPEGPIVTVENKKGAVQTENSDAECLDIPIVLLIDENTASAAELFTMALKDYDMCQTVGTTTYGKGIVQSIFMLSDGSGLKFTTEKYYGPAGNCIQDTGIEPDYEVILPEEVYEDGVIDVTEDVQLQKAAELLGEELDLEALAAEVEAENALPEEE